MKIKLVLLIILSLSFQNSFSQNQDINLTGNGIDIFNGGTNSPSLNNDTDFGEVVLNSISQVTLTIENTHHGGSPNKNKLTVNSITISGPNADDFVVSGISLPKSINRNNSTTFLITFTATQLGNETALVSISSDDPDENPYTFNIKGTGIEVGTNPSLTLTNTYPLSVLEPSGLTFDKVNNELLTVSDNTAQVFRISLTGNVLQTYGYSGVDTEGVTFYTPNKVLITEERSRELIEYDYVNDTAIIHPMSYTNDTSGDQNSGIEGVSYDPATGTIFFLGEFPPVLVHANSSFTVTNEYPLAYSADISASYFVEETGYLWLASHEESTIYKCEIDGTVINSFYVTTAGGVDIPQLEGIAIDHANQLLYAVSDSSQELFVFNIYDPTIDPPTIVAVEDTFSTLDGINGETTSYSVIDNDILNDSPTNLTEVSLSAISILDPSNNPTSDVVLNADGTVTALTNTETGDYSLTYEICELADPSNCSQVTNTISVLGPAPSTTDVIVAGDSWKYYDNENEPPGSWKALGYDDSTWGSGNAVLGFNNGENTSLNSATITAYFRKTISITNSGSITNIDLSAIRDDGMIVYVNGLEVWRDNMPTGNVSYSDQASSYIKDAAETTWINQSIANNLVDGNNIVSVEIHIKRPKGRNKVPDMSFDFSMTTTSGVSNSPQIIDNFSLNSEKEAIVYPVPADRILNIDFKDDYSEFLNASIYNKFGVLVKMSPNKTIDVSQLKPDIYFVIINTAHSTINKKIIIDHK